MPGGSNLSRLTALEFSESFGCELIESPLCGITFDLAIPRLPVMLHEPATERSELLGGKLLDFAFKSFNLCHDIQSLRYPPQIPHSDKQHTDSQEVLSARMTIWQPDRVLQRR